MIMLMMTVTAIMVTDRRRQRKNIRETSQQGMCRMTHPLFSVMGTFLAETRNFFRNGTE